MKAALKAHLGDNFVYPWRLPQGHQPSCPTEKQTKITSIIDWTEFLTQWCDRKTCLTCNFTEKLSKLAIFKPETDVCPCLLILATPGKNCELRNILNPLWTLWLAHILSMQTFYEYTAPKCLVYSITLNLLIGSIHIWSQILKKVGRSSCIWFY